LHFNANKKNDEHSFDSLRHTVVSIDNLRVDSNSRVTFTKRIKSVFPVQPEDIVSVYQNRDYGSIIFNIQRREETIDTLVCKRVGQLENGLLVESKLPHANAQHTPKSSIGVSENATNLTNTDRPNKNIMVIDDDVDILATFKLVLDEERDFHVEAFADPVEALIRFTEMDSFFYDLVIADIRMPCLNGLKLYKIMSRFKENIRFLFVSALEYADEFIQLLPGFDKSRIIVKPIDNDLFKGKIRQVLTTQKN
jgi:CheY-like chemotaxis protein